MIRISLVSAVFTLLLALPAWVRADETEDRLAALDPLVLLDDERPAGSELRHPLPRPRLGVGEVAEHVAGVGEVHRSLRPGQAQQVVAEEPAAGQRRAGEPQEVLRQVEAHQATGWLWVRLMVKSRKCLRPRNCAAVKSFGVGMGSLVA